MRLCMVLLPALCLGTDKVLEVGELEGSTGSEAGIGFAEQMESNGCRRCA